MPDAVLLTENQEYTENTILVEGDDDKSLLEYLIKKRNINIPQLTISKPANNGGLGALIKTLKNFFINSGANSVKKLLIFADADKESPQKKFQTIKSALGGQRFRTLKTLATLPRRNSSKIKTGVFIFPDNSNKGTLETLCMKTVKERNKEECIEDYLQCVKKKKLLKTPLCKLDKSRLHIYLSTTKNPSIHIRGALQNKELNLNSTIYSKVIEFLKLLT